MHLNVVILSITKPLKCSIKRLLRSNRNTCIEERGTNSRSITASVWELFFFLLLFKFCCVFFFFTGISWALWNQVWKDSPSVQFGECAAETQSYILTFWSFHYFVLKAQISIDLPQRCDFLHKPVASTFIILLECFFFMSYRLHLYF